MASPPKSNPAINKILQNCSDEKDCEEEVPWVVDDNDDEEIRASLTLIGKLWTKKHINAKALMDTIRTIRNPKHGLKARKVEENVFSFQFFHWQDKHRVLEGQPWHFDRHALCLSEIDEDGQPYEFQLNSMPIWARFYNLPFKGRSNEANAQTLANKVGTFFRMDRRDDVDIERSLRVRVILDLNKPLKDSVRLKLRGGDVSMVNVKFERLPLVCFVCGCIGHNDRECEEYEEDSTVPKKLGTWIRASPWKMGGAGSKNSEDGGASCKEKLFVPKPVVKKDSKVEQSMGRVLTHLADVNLNTDRVDIDGRDDVNVTEKPTVSEQIEGNVEGYIHE